MATWPEKPALDKTSLYTSFSLIKSFKEISGQVANLVRQISLWARKGAENGLFRPKSAPFFGQ
jgi:hypothetical protein